MVAHFTSKISTAGINFNPNLRQNVVVAGTPNFNLALLASDQNAPRS